jgi:hypothetical protein
MRIVDVPKLMDFACIYGTDNLAECRSLVSRILDLDGRFLDDVASTIGFATNVRRVRRPVTPSASRECRAPWATDPG